MNPAAPSPDARHERGPFDLIGDVHGCAGELERLLAALGYDVAHEGVPGQRAYAVTPPRGRRAVFLGDLVDRGPRSPDVIRLAAGMVRAGTALCVLGNHDDKLRRKLAGRNVQLTHGLAETMDQLASQPEGFGDEARAFLEALPSHLVLDGGALIAAHAGLREDLHGAVSGAARSFALYGDVSGERDAYGLPVRRDWAALYRGRPAVVYGHTPTRETAWVNGTICIDQGCVFGGRLTALRWPEREVVSVPAERAWAIAPRPFLEARASA